MNTKCMKSRKPSRPTSVANEAIAPIEGGLTHGAQKAGNGIISFALCASAAEKHSVDTRTLTGSRIVSIAAGFCFPKPSIRAISGGSGALTPGV